jgi:hypothetical protein
MTTRGFYSTYGKTEYVQRIRGLNAEERELRINYFYELVGQELEQRERSWKAYCQANGKSLAGYNLPLLSKPYTANRVNSYLFDYCTQIVANRAACEKTTTMELVASDLMTDETTTGGYKTKSLNSLMYNALSIKLVELTSSF